MRHGKLAVGLCVLFGLCLSRPFAVGGEDLAQKARRLIDEAKKDKGQAAVDKLIGQTGESAEGFARQLGQTNPGEAARILVAIASVLAEDGAKATDKVVRGWYLEVIGSRILGARPYGAISFAQQSAAKDPKGAATVMVDAAAVLAKVGAKAEPRDPAIVGLIRRYLLAGEGGSARDFVTKFAPDDPMAAIDLMSRMAGILRSVGDTTAARDCLSIYARRFARQIQDTKKRMITQTEIDDTLSEQD